MKNSQLGIALGWVLALASPAIAQEAGGALNGDGNSTLGADGFSGPSVKKAGDTCGTWPGSPLYVFDGDSIDGANNTTIANGDLVASWVNLGSVGAAGNAVQATGERQPTAELKVFNGRSAVSFDGSSDWLTIGASTTSMTSFLTTKRGHIVIVYRHDAQKVSGYGQLFANGNSIGTPGFQWGINANGTGFVYLVGAGGTYKGFDPSTSVPTGVWKWHQLKSNATTLSYQQYGNTAQTTSITSGFSTGAGPLPVEVSIGSRTGSVAETVDGAVAFLAYYADQLGSTDQTALDGWLTCRYGF